jgi:hypothetical protein
LQQSRLNPTLHIFSALSKVVYPVGTPLPSFSPAYSWNTDARRFSNNQLIIWPLNYLSFDLRLLITSLWYLQTKYGELSWDGFVAATINLPFSKYTKEAFSLQGAWHYPNKLPTMVQDHAYPIITFHHIHHRRISPIHHMGRNRWSAMIVLSAPNIKIRNWNKNKYEKKYIHSFEFRRYLLLK